MKIGTPLKQIEKEEQTSCMPFGKHKGTLISELPVEYIIFILQRCLFIDKWLVEKLETELDKRKEALPCFGKLFDSNSRQCSKCSFLDPCASECGFLEDDSSGYEEDLEHEDWGDIN